MTTNHGLAVIALEYFYLQVIELIFVIMGHDIAFVESGKRNSIRNVQNAPYGSGSYRT
jgi:hypothetical protein